MSKTWKWVIGIVVAVVVIGGWLVGYYNRFVTSNESVDGQWAQVETAYQRRFDLIPNLVEATKGIFEQEREVFGRLADARAAYANPGTPEQRVAAANQVEGALTRLLAVFENYPQLRSSEAVRDLMAQLEGTENRISVERRRYNEIVQSYNVIVKRFPGKFLASLYGFSERTFFAAAPGADTAPKVDLQLP